MVSKEKKAWYYWWNPEEAKWYILAFVNGLGSCSMRRWRAADGKAVPPVAYKKKCDFQEAFPEYLNGTSSLRLWPTWKSQVNDWREELPKEVLSEVRKLVQEWIDNLSASIS